MSIVIGFNSFHPGTRHQVALDSWLHLQQHGFVDDIHDVQFDGVQNHNEVSTLNKLTRDSTDVVLQSTKRLPIIKDVFDILSDQSCEYFIFTNSDVIINKNLIKHINKHKPDAMACSRMNIHPIDSFERVLAKDISPTKYEIAGFDTFVLKRDWYLHNRDIFNDYLIGMPIWDVVFTGMFKLFGGNHPLGNQNPPFCFHVEHEITWQQDRQAPERTYNDTLMKNTHLDRLVYDVINKHIVDVLITRQPIGTFFKPVMNETSIEQSHFQPYTNR